MKKIGQKTTLQYISDIHLEKRTYIPKLSVSSENLGLIGDIGNPYKDNYKEFLMYTSYNYERIFLISGNHEYWDYYNNRDYNNGVYKHDVDNKITNITDKFSNIEFLNNTQTQLNEYTVVGSTLWTEGVNNTEFKKSVNYLKDVITKDNNNKKIILTHYIPSFKLNTKYFKNPKYDSIRYRFASNLEYLIKDPVKFWLCGHSHCNINMYINDIYCGINAVGPTMNPIHMTNRVIDLV